MSGVPSCGAAAPRRGVWHKSSRTPGRLVRMAYGFFAPSPCRNGVAPRFAAAAQPTLRQPQTTRPSAHSHRANTGGGHARAYRCAVPQVENIGRRFFYALATRTCAPALNTRANNPIPHAQRAIRNQSSDRDDENLRHRHLGVPGASTPPCYCALRIAQRQRDPLRCNPKAV